MRKTAKLTRFVHIVELLLSKKLLEWDIALVVKLLTACTRLVEESKIKAPELPGFFYCPIKAIIKKLMLLFRYDRRPGFWNQKDNYGMQGSLSNWKKRFRAKGKKWCKKIYPVHHLLFVDFANRTFRFRKVIQRKRTSNCCVDKDRIFQYFI